ncbi:hypothetical protein BVRB_5g100440 isoform B [Beta vulgaris subsp. vulgaris]|nr:hypothetical protein BVRB_5g100440 isoform B [Beta vulgaris subsp. vulgaris]
MNRSWSNPFLISTIETLWLKGDAKFLLGNDKPSVADLSLVCEIMQLHVK